jgi:hypothetical protein
MKIQELILTQATKLLMSKETIDSGFEEAMLIGLTNLSTEKKIDGESPVFLLWLGASVNADGNAEILIEINYKYLSDKNKTIHTETTTLSDFLQFSGNLAEAAKYLKLLKNKQINKALAENTIDGLCVKYAVTVFGAMQRKYCNKEEHYRILIRNVTSDKILCSQFAVSNLCSKPRPILRPASKEASDQKPSNTVYLHEFLPSIEEMQKMNT